MTGSKRQVVIIGAGIGGLVAAAILSRHAHVTVLERAPIAGGKIGQRRIGNQSIDTGPTVLTMKPVFDEIFAEAGDELDQRVSLPPVETLARHFWPGGATLDLFPDAARSAAAIADFASPAEADRYRAFCQRSEAVFDTLAKPFLFAPKPSMPALLGSSNWNALRRIEPFTSLWNALGRQFKDPRLQQLFARYATYCGASPFQAPATLMLIAHVERSGVWSIDGGIHRLAAALVDLASENGAVFRYGEEATDIEVSGRRVSGVHARGVGRLSADMVVCNADTAAMATGLLGHVATRAVGNERDVPRSLSAMTWTFAAKPTGAKLAEHNVFFSNDYRDEFDAVFQRGTPPQEPTVYLHAPDPTASGEQVVYCLINAPANGGRGKYGVGEVEACWTRMNEQLKRCGVVLDILPETVAVTTPDQFAARFPSTQGALYGAAGHGWQAAFRRRGVKTRLRGLYLAGGSVHPGPGVPMAALSGRAAARAAMSDFGLTAAFPQAAMPGGTLTA